MDYREREIVDRNGNPLTEEEASFALLLLDGGYDITNPELDNHSIDELLPRIIVRSYHQN